MPKKKSSSFSKKQSGNPFALLLFAILGIGLLIVIYKAVTSTSTESRSKAAETEIVVNNWEFNGTTKEGWTGTNLSIGSVRNGTFYTVIVNDIKQSTLQQNTVDGPFANIILQKLKFSLKVADPPSKAVRITPTPSRKPFTGEVRYMVSGKTTWEEPQTFSGVIDNQFQTYEVSLAALPDVDITKLQITFPLFLKSTQIYLDWIRLTAIPLPTPTPTPTPILGFNKMVQLDGFMSYLKVNDSLARLPDITKDFTIEGFFKVYSCRINQGYISGLFSRGPAIGSYSNYSAIIHKGSGPVDDCRKFMFDLDNKNNTTYDPQIISITDIITSKWYHFAITKSNNDLSLYLNGKLDKKVNISSKAIFANEGKMVFIGASYGYSNTSDPSYILYGNLDEIRISNIVRYSSDFIVPKSAFNNDQNTVALYHLDGDGKDSSGNGYHAEAIGHVSYSNSDIK